MVEPKLERVQPRWELHGAWQVAKKLPKRRRAGHGVTEAPVKWPSPGVLVDGTARRLASPRVIAIDQTRTLLRLPGGGNGPAVGRVGRVRGNGFSDRHPQPQRLADPACDGPVSALAKPSATGVGSNGGVSCDRGGRDEHDRRDRNGDSAVQRRFSRGEDRRSTPAHRCHALAERAGAKITEVEGSHVIMVSQAEAVTEVILKALAAVR